MALIHGGEKVRGGFYWNARKWDATFVEGTAGVLPGTADDAFRRVPVVLVLLAAPIMGALFVIFLPFIGIALMVRQMGIATFELAERVVMAGKPEWLPRVAFSEKHREPASPAEPIARADSIGESAKAIEERR